MKNICSYFNFKLTLNLFSSYEMLYSKKRLGKWKGKRFIEWNGIESQGILIFIILSLCKVPHHQTITVCSFLSWKVYVSTLTWIFYGAKIYNLDNFIFMQPYLKAMLKCLMFMYILGTTLTPCVSSPLVYYYSELMFYFLWLREKITKSKIEHI